MIFPASGGAVLCLDIRSFGFTFLQGAPEPIGLGPGLNDIGAISNAVDQCLAQPGIGNHRGPFRKRQIGSSDDGGLLGPFGKLPGTETLCGLGQRG